MRQAIWWSPLADAISVTAFRKSILLCPFFVLCAATVYATGEDYIDETLVYLTVERGVGGSESRQCPAQNRADSEDYDWG